MEHKLMKRAALWSLCFSVAAVGITLYLSLQKTDVPAQAPGVQTDAEMNGSADAGSGENGKGTVSANELAEEAARGQTVPEPEEDEEVLFLLDGEEQELKKLTFSQEETDTSYLRVPLPDGCRAEDISIENYYMDQELWILLDGAEGGFYEENAISGNREMVRQGIYEEEEAGTKLRFKLTGIFEYHTILENNELYISFLSPGEVYDRIVVIDPAWGGLQSGYAEDDLKEKEINLAIAEKLKERLDQTDIRVYYTRMDDINPGKESRIRLANETRADLYIRIELGTDEDSSVYGTTAVYNKDFFIPGFGSMELAELLETEIVDSVKGKALGLTEAEESEDILRNITVPAVIARVGYATNKQEATLLVREEYQEKIADGIYNAILKAFEQKDS